MHFIRSFEHFLVAYAAVVPLPWFVFIGSLAEELISPLTAVLIMGTAGSLAAVQGHTLGYVFLLAALGSFGRTLGAWIYYVLGDRFENLIIGKASKFLGVKHEDVENIGKRFTGHHWKDGGALFIMRIIPFFPTTIVSVAAGVIRMDRRVFLGATYGGHLLKDFLYVYAGYVGLRTAHALWRSFAPFRAGAHLLGLIALVALVAAWYFRFGPGSRKTVPPSESQN